MWSFRYSDVDYVNDLEIYNIPCVCAIVTRWSILQRLSPLVFHKHDLFIVWAVKTLQCHFKTHQNKISTISKWPSLKAMIERKQERTNHRAKESLSNLSYAIHDLLSIVIDFVFILLWRIKQCFSCHDTSLHFLPLVREITLIDSINTAITEPPSPITRFCHRIATMVAGCVQSFKVPDSDSVIMMKLQLHFSISF